MARKRRENDMYYQCLNISCETSFDSDTAPLTCPFCGSDEGFAKIRITDDNGRELTYAEHIKDLREYYLSHLPHGLSRTDINSMTDRELEDMNDILSE